MSQVYFGAEESLFVFEVGSDGRHALARRLDLGAAPSFLAFREGGQVMDVVREGADEIVTFSLAGEPRVIGRVLAPGGPCHLRVDAASKTAVASCYGGGHALHYTLRSDRSLEGPLRTIAIGPKTHSASIDPTTGAFFASSLDANVIEELRFSGLACERKRALSMPRGAGPRLFEFSADGAWLYVIGEFDARLHAFERAAEGFVWRFARALCPGPVTAADSGAHVELSSDGRFAYASSRGQNWVTVFARGHSGDLQLIQRVDSGGAIPRHFSLIELEGEAFVTVANQESHRVTFFSRNAASGLLQARFNLQIDQRVFWAGTAR